MRKLRCLCLTITISIIYKQKGYASNKINGGHLKEDKMSISRQDKIRGSLLGGAIGDALGYPVEFMSYSQIKSKFGENGIT